MQLKIEYVPAADLVPYSGNAKAHPAEQIEQIKASIAEFGFNDPIAVWKGNEIIEGHGRLLAAQEMGLDKVPVIRLDALTDEQRRAYTLAHNKLTMNSGFDIDILTAELGAIEEIDMEQFGFDFSDVMPEDEMDPEPEAEEDDFDEAPPEEPEAHVGDLYQLGRHRLICGDSTDTYVVDRLMGGVEADMVMTDPPYGINAEKMTMGSGAKDFYRGSDWDSERPSITLAMMLAPDVCIWGGELLCRRVADIERLACMAQKERRTFVQRVRTCMDQLRQECAASVASLGQRKEAPCNDEAGARDCVGHSASEKPGRGHRGLVRRKRHDNDCLRAVGSDVLYGRIRPAVRRCHYQTLGSVYGRKGGVAE